jgi:predicted transcriptional regulator
MEIRGGKMRHTRKLLKLTANIVSAYVENNEVPSSDVPGLIDIVHGTLAECATPTSKPEQGLTKVKPAVPVGKSVFEDCIVCLEDGQKFKSLKRHLRAKYNMSPDEYRQKWGLPSTYPMVAPEYARTRSELARKIGLGQSRKKKTL